jgi:hypothetical protein
MVPPGLATGTVDVTVSVAGQTSATGAADQFVYYTPGMLRVATSPAVPSQIRIDGNIAETWSTTWVKVAPGSHQVCFGDVVGFTTPGCQTVSVTSGQTTTVTGTFAQEGYLRVETSPAVPSEITVNGNPADDYGVWSLFPAGSYQVCFAQVAGFDPPACQSATVTAGQTTTLTGVFTPDSTAVGQPGVGRLRVTTSPAVASVISVDGNPADQWAVNYLELPAGSHQVCFSGIQGFVTPACQTVTISSGVTTTTVGSFVQTGFLKVATSPAAPGTIYVDGLPRDDWGLYTDFPAGSYVVCFGVVPGITAPACQTATVTAGTTTPITGKYS